MSDNNDNKFQNPYLKGTHPEMDYKEILNEYRQKGDIDPEILFKKKSLMDLDRSSLLDPLDGAAEEEGNRFSFDLKRDVIGGIDLNDLRSVSKVSYSDSYKPKKVNINVERNYADLANADGVNSSEVRQAIGRRKRTAVSNHPSPVSKPRETIEEKRARISKLLPDAQEQRELKRLAENKKIIYSTPSFMQDEIVLSEPGIEDTDVVTPLRNNVNLPGFTYRQRYLHQGIQGYENETIPKAVMPVGFGGEGGDIPEFESESSNWASRPDEERFAPPEPMENYGNIPLEHMVNKKNVRRAKVRVGDKKVAAAYQAGAGATAAYDEQRHKKAVELADKKRRIERRVNGAKGIEDNAVLPSGFSDLDAISQEAVENAHMAGVQSGREFADVPSPVNNSRVFVAYNENTAVPNSQFAPPQNTPQNGRFDDLAPKQNTFTDGNFEKNRSGQGIINRKKSTYSYLFDDDEEIPDNITNVEKAAASGNGASDYSYLFMSDDDIDNQINAAREAKNKKNNENAVYAEPIGFSGNKGNFQSLNAAVKNQAELENVGGFIPITENEDEKTSSKAAPMTLKKGNITFKPLGDISAVKKSGKIVTTGISEKYIPENAAAADMPKSVPFANGFSGVSPSGAQNVPPQNFSSVQNGVSAANNIPPFEPQNQNLNYDVQYAQPAASSNVILFEAAVAYKNSLAADNGEADENNIEERREGLYKKVQNVIFSIGSSAVAFLLLFVLELLPQVGVTMPDALNPSTAPYVYYGLNLIIMVMCIVFCRDTVFGGFKDLFTGKPGYRSFCAVAGAAVTAHTVSSFIQSINGGASQRVYATAYLLALVILETGSLFKLMRIGKGLTFMSSDRKRGALLVAGVQDGANSINAACDYNDGSIVAYHVKTKRLKNYFKYAEEEDLSEQIASKTFLWMMAGCVICSAISAFITKSVYGFFSAFALCTVISTPFTAEISNNLPLANLSKKLLKRGAMISGWSAVSEFSDTNIVLLDSEEIFPQDTVELVGIKTFGDKRIDRAILDAAALAISTGGTLGGVFSKLIADNVDVLPAVENPKFEDGYGLSGWVKGRRILLGNKAMLELYGVETLIRDYDTMYEEEGSKLLYLSANGEISAMFILKYHTDGQVRKNLYDFAESGITIAVRSCDVNITPKLISTTFGVYHNLIKVLPASVTPVADMLISEEKESVPAVVSTNRTISAMATVLSSVIKIKSRLIIAVVLQTIGTVVGLAFGLFLSVTDACGDFSPVQMTLYCAFWALAVIVIPNIKRIIK